MDPKKLDRIISIIREEMMTANPPGMGGGGGSQTDPKGTKGLVGYDPVMGLSRRKKIIGLGKNSRNRWKKPKQ